MTSPAADSCAESPPPWRCRRCPDRTTLTGPLPLRRPSVLALALPPVTVRSSTSSSARSVPRVDHGAGVVALHDRAVAQDREPVGARILELATRDRDRRRDHGGVDADRAAVGGVGVGERLAQTAGAGVGRRRDDEGSALRAAPAGALANYATASPETQRAPAAKACSAALITDPAHRRGKRSQPRESEAS